MKQSNKREPRSMRVAAHQADAVANHHEASSIHVVDGVGRYAIPYDAGWNALLSAIHDATVGIGFNPAAYPAFDSAIAQAFDSTALHDDLHLRDNIAAVRNFLMQTYYMETPPGMTPEKAKQSLEEIAAFIGNGLYNHLRFGTGADPAKPYVDLAQASLPDGVGAQYIYERILSMHRQSAWMRPFSAIVTLFGGKIMADWMLPNSHSTPFHTLSNDDLKRLALGDDATPEEIDAAMAHLDQLEAQRAALDEKMLATAAASDLSVIGDQLIYTAEHMNDVAAMSEPVRQDAVEIAKDILRKLKLSLGGTNITEGLQIEPEDAISALGALKGVATVFERLLAWGRGIDGSIMQHPSIIAAIHAIGQAGYVAKVDSLRVAKLVGNILFMKQLEEQLNSIPKAYRDINDPEFAALLDKVERGIDTLQTRVQTISGPGAAVGHSPTKELGSYMSGTPIAGQAMQAKAEGTGRDGARQQQAIQEGVANAQRAQVQRIAQQLGSQQTRGTSGVNPNPPRGSISGQLATIRTRLTQARRNSTTQTTINAARQNLQNAQWNALHGQDHQDPHHAPVTATPPRPDPMAATVAKIDPRIINNIRAMNTMTAGLTNNAVLTGKAAFNKMQNANTYGLKPSPTPPKPTEEEKRKLQQQENPQPGMGPNNPNNKGGRGI